jgi:hypothetical protein
VLLLLYIHQALLQQELQRTYLFRLLLGRHLLLLLSSNHLQQLGMRPLLLRTGLASLHVQCPYTWLQCCFVQLALQLLPVDLALGTLCLADTVVLCFVLRELSGQVGLLLLLLLLLRQLWDQQQWHPMEMRQLPVLQHLQQETLESLPVHLLHLVLLSQQAAAAQVEVQAAAAAAAAIWLQALLLR